MQPSPECDTDASGALQRRPSGWSRFIGAAGVFQNPAKNREAAPPASLVVKAPGGPRQASTSAITEEGQSHAILLSKGAGEFFAAGGVANARIVLMLDAIGGTGDGALAVREFGALSVSPLDPCYGADGESQLSESGAPVSLGTAFKALDPRTENPSISKWAGRRSCPWYLRATVSVLRLNSGPGTGKASVKFTAGVANGRLG